MIDRPSPNFDARAQNIDLVVLHYTGMATQDIALARLCDPAPIAGRYRGPWQAPDIDPNEPLGRVSAHYVAGEAGEIFKLVAEEQRAWHAGQGFWRGAAEINGRAIGIEIVNGGHDYGLPDFAAPQIRSVIELVGDILRRRNLPPSSVVAHSDVAPARKRDPGERFPWIALAQAGVSIWPKRFNPPGGQVIGEPGEESEGVARLQRAFAAFGYGLAETGRYDGETEAIVRAFQRRFRPDRIDGVCDAETLDILADLNDQLGLDAEPPVDA